MNRLDPEQTYQLAHLLCHKLALDLDAEDYSSVQMVSDFLMECPTELVIQAVSQQVRLERCVKHNLDEDVFFQKVLMRLNDAANEAASYVEDKDSHHP